MQNNDQASTDRTTGVSIWSGFGLTLLGTTCCALPITLVALGMGGAVASLVSVLPWLKALSQYKAITFSVTGLVLVYSIYRLRQARQCDIHAAQTLKWQRRMLIISGVIFALSLFAAYGLLPLVLWLDQ